MTEPVIVNSGCMYLFMIIPLLWGLHLLTTQVNNLLEILKTRDPNVYVMTNIMQVPCTFMVSFILNGICNIYCIDTYPYILIFYI